MPPPTPISPTRWQRRLNLAEQHVQFANLSVLSLQLPLLCLHLVFERLNHLSKDTRFIVTG